MKAAILKILILGGTNFLEPHLVEELQEHGHEVTLFNRGTQPLSPVPPVEILQGNIDENHPLAILEDQANEEINEKTYGALKASCEKVIERYFPDRFLVIRPGLIVGPGDPTHRFSYWPLRLVDGGEILARGSPMQNLQFIDVRDLAKWIVAMVEQKKTGFYNATGPASSLNFAEFLNAFSTLSNKENSLSWVKEEFLIDHGVQDWVELPLWLSYKRHMSGFLNVEVIKASKLA